MKTEVHFSSKTDLWATPQELFDNLNETYNFDLDVCAIPENAKCDRYFTPEQDGLKQEWKGFCWMNPPYGRQIGHWIRKAFSESRRGATVVCLLPARTDTKWFHQYIYNKPNVELEFLSGRLKFGGSKTNAPFPSMIVIFRGI